MLFIPDHPEVRHARNRGHMKTDWLTAHFSFNFADFHEVGRSHFGALRVLNEDRIEPAKGFQMHPHSDLEILLLPLSGAVFHEDSLGNQIAVQPNELLTIRAGRGIWHSQMNASSVHADHHFQLWFTPRKQGVEPVASLRRFGQAERETRWQLWASGHGEPEVVEIDADARVFRARITAAQRLDSTFERGKRLYLHVATGAVQLQTSLGNSEMLHLQAGDAVVWQKSAPFTLQASPQEHAEVLLLDLGSL